MYENLQAVTTMEAPAALGAYSQAVKANGFVFVSGQLGIDPATGELDGVTAAEQAARATIYLRNVADFSEVDGVYAKTVTGTVKPARVAFGNNMIPKGALVEIDVIAVCPQN